MVVKWMMKVFADFIVRCINEILPDLKSKNAIAHRMRRLQSKYSILKSLLSMEYWFFAPSTLTYAKQLWMVIVCVFLRLSLSLVSFTLCSPETSKSWQFYVNKNLPTTIYTMTCYRPNRIRSLRLFNDRFRMINYEIFSRVIVEPTILIESHKHQIIKQHHLMWGGNVSVCERGIIENKLIIALATVNGTDERCVMSAVFNVQCDAFWRMETNKRTSGNKHIINEYVAFLIMVLILGASYLCDHIIMSGRY